MADCMKSASEALHQILVEGLGRLVGEGKLPAEPIPAFRVEIPADKSHGDFAANVAMVSAKDFDKPDSPNPDYKNFMIKNIGFAAFKNGIQVSEIKEFKVVCSASYGKLEYAVLTD